MIKLTVYILFVLTATAFSQVDSIITILITAILNPLLIIKMGYGMVKQSTSVKTVMLNKNFPILMEK